MMNYNKSLMLTTVLPQRIYTVGAILKGFESKFTQYLTDGDLVLKLDTFEIAKVTGVVDNVTALLDKAFVADIDPEETESVITDGGQDLVVVSAKNDSTEQGLRQIVAGIERILGGVATSEMIDGAVTGRKIDLIVVNDVSVISDLIDSEGNDALVYLGLNDVELQPGTVIRANNGLTIAEVTVSLGSVMSYSL